MRRTDRPQSSATRFRVSLIAFSLLISSLGLSLGSTQIAHAENCQIYLTKAGRAFGIGDIGGGARWQQEYKNCNARNANAIKASSGTEVRLDCSSYTTGFVNAITRGEITLAANWKKKIDDCNAYNRGVDERAREAAAKAAAARAAATPTQTVKPAATPSPSPTPTFLKELPVPQGLTFVGSARVGNRVEITWRNPTDYDSVTFKWVRACTEMETAPWWRPGSCPTDIPGANKISHTITNEDVGWKIYCEILFKKNGFADRRDFVWVTSSNYGVATPAPTATAASTIKPATPTPTIKPATPTPTIKPATPTPTIKPATPTPTVKPATPTPTIKSATPTPTIKPATPTPTPTPTPTVKPATPTPTPTVKPATPTPTPTPTPTVKPATPTPTPSSGNTQQLLTIGTLSIPKLVTESFLLKPAGGTGDGAVSFATSSPGCVISGDVLTTTNTSGETTCAVTVTKAASNGYNAATSNPKIFTFRPLPIATNPIDQNLLIVGTLSIPKFLNESFLLKPGGGSGDGAVSFATSSPGCVISGDKLSTTNISGETTCAVTVTKAASTGYNAATSSPKTFTFRPIPTATNPISQNILTIRNITTTLFLTESVKLLPGGGSGDGAVSFATSSPGCVISGDILTTTNTSATSTCAVTASKAASIGYLAAVSAAKIFTFTKP